MEPAADPKEPDARKGLEGGCGLAFSLLVLAGMVPTIAVFVWSAGPALLWREYYALPTEDQVGALFTIALFFVVPFALLAAAGMGWKALKKTGRHVVRGARDDPS